MLWPYADLNLTLRLGESALPLQPTACLVAPSWYNDHWTHLLECPTNISNKNVQN